MIGAACPACSARPSGIAGHGRLEVLSIGSAVLSFRCQECQSLWTRASIKGRFAWDPIDEEVLHTPAMGVVVPPRSDAYYAAPAELARFRLLPRFR
jgi:hypothetical protein